MFQIVKGLNLGLIEEAQHFVIVRCDLCDSVAIVGETKAPTSFVVFLSRRSIEGIMNKDVLPCIFLSWDMAQPCPSSGQPC